MLTTRKVTQRIGASAMREGAGVTVHRTLGTPARRHLDPFLMLDHFGSDQPEQYIAGFPDHPHRGFITLTYMLDGHMLHRDSMGNSGDLQAGGAQWMKAASGVIHSEMPQQDKGLMRGFQLWINLPAAEKMSAPEYREFASDAFPVVREAGREIRVLSGEYHGARGPIVDAHTGLSYFDVRLDASAEFVCDLAGELSIFAYLFEGDAASGETALPEHTLAIFGDGDRVEFKAGERGARLILVSARPLHEPIVQYGPFVMNTREEIEQALADFRDGRLVQIGNAAAKPGGQLQQSVSAG